MIDRICECCGNAFKTYPSRIKIGQGRHCSGLCARRSTGAAYHARKVEEKKPRHNEELGCYDIPLGNGHVALIDREDLQSVGQHAWATRKELKKGAIRYAVTRIGGVTISMHVFLMGRRQGMQVDHKNHNGLDNRRSNLRWATPSQNAANSRRFIKKTSMYRGVRRLNGMWAAQINRTENGERVWQHLGYFESEDGAARAFDAAALKEWGEFAPLNFPANTK